LLNKEYLGDQMKEDEMGGLAERMEEVTHTEF
jgi:hypothetical protein